MYQFEKTTDLKTFDQFVMDNHGSIFQTSKGATLKSNWTPSYLVGYDKNELVMTCLILYRQVSIFKLAYIPFGFVCDYQNEVLVKETVRYLKKLLKKEKAALGFIDPAVELSRSEVFNPTGQQLQKIFNEYGLRKTKNRPYVQPDATFIVELADEQHQPKALSDIVAQFEKGVRYTVRTSEDKGLAYQSLNYQEVQEQPELFEEFINIMYETMDRLDALTRDKTYFANMLKCFDPYIRLNMVYYDYEADRQHCLENEQLLQTASKKHKNEIQSKIDAFKKREKELLDHGVNLQERLYLAGGLTVTFGGKSVCLYGGSKNLLRNTLRTSHYLNYKRIEDSVNNHCFDHDLSRIYIPKKTPEAESYGLYKFKLSFGAKEVQYVGEYQFINNKLFAFLFMEVLPAFRRLLVLIKRRK